MFNVTVTQCSQKGFLFVFLMCKFTFPQLLIIHRKKKKKKKDQKFKESDSPDVSCSCESPPRPVIPALVSPAQ